MTNKDELNAKVYQPIKEVKQLMYECKTKEEWDRHKGQLVELLMVAKSMMDKDFYPKYKQGIVDSISKIYGFKEKQFNKKTFQSAPKQSFIFREEEGKAFIQLCETLSQFLRLKNGIELKLN